MTLDAKDAAKDAEEAFNDAECAIDAVNDSYNEVSCNKKQKPL